MPFQHIATTSSQLLDTDASGFGTVAKTRSLSASLSQRIEQFSRSLIQSAQDDTEPVFTYQIIEHEGAYYHVLSRTISCGETPEGKPNHLSHHLICTRQEVKNLLRHPSRPTPAGLALALSAADFWKNEWKEAPAILSDAFSFSARYLPDASQQATWQDLTGHKRNARILSLPRYNHGCLILLPDSSDFSTKLTLNHESDWITHTRGWGTTFTTHLPSPGSPTDFSRIYTRKGTVSEEYIKNCKRDIISVDENLLCEDTPTKQSRSTEGATAISTDPSSNKEQTDKLPEVPRLKYRRKTKKQRLYALVSGGVLMIGACALLARSCNQAPEVATQPDQEIPIPPQQSDASSAQQKDEFPNQGSTLPNAKSPTVESAQQESATVPAPSPDKQQTGENPLPQLVQEEQRSDIEDEQPAPFPQQAVILPLRSTSTTILIGEDKTPESVRTAFDNADKTINRANWDWISLNNGNLSSILRSGKNNDATDLPSNQKDIVLSVTLPDEANENVGQRFIITPKIQVNTCTRTQVQFPAPQFESNEKAQTPSRSSSSGYYRFSANQIFSEGSLLVPVQLESSEPLTLPVIPDRDASEANATLVNEVVLPEGWTATQLPALEESHTEQYMLTANRTIDLTPQADDLIERVFNKKRKDRDNMPSASLAYICRMLWLIDTAQDSTAISKYLTLFANRDGKTRQYLKTLMEGKAGASPYLTPNSSSVKNKTSRSRLANELKKPHAVSDLLQALRHDMQIQIEQEIKNHEPQNFSLPTPLELNTVRLEGNRLIWIFRQSDNS